MEKRRRNGKVIASGGLNLMKADSFVTLQRMLMSQCEIYTQSIR